MRAIYAAPTAEMQPLTGKNGTAEEPEDDEWEYEEEEEDSAEPKENKLPWWIRYSTVMKVIFVPSFFFAGALFLHVEEGWSFLTSFYVCMQIVTTVGYGDVTVSNPHSYVFMTVYVLVIILFIADVVNDIGEYVAAKESSALIDVFDDVAERKAKELQQLDDKTIPYRLTWMHKYHVTRLMVAFVLFVSLAMFGTIFYADYEDCSCSYGVSREGGFPSCVLKANETDANGVVHAEPNCASEGQTKDYLKAFYMSIVTMTTVGYGDFSPMSRLGRGIAIVWMLLGVIASGNFVTALSSSIRAYVKATKRAAKKSSVSLPECDEGNKGYLTRNEFLRYMIKKHDKIRAVQLESIDNLFDTLDVNKSDSVTLDEIRARLASDEKM